MEDNLNINPTDGNEEKVDGANNIPESIDEDTLNIEPASENSETVHEDLDATKDFAPITQDIDPDGSTRPFETVENKTEKQADPGKKQKSKSPAKKPKFGRSKTAVAAKATVGSLLFVVRKALTYLLNILLTVLVVGIITGAVVVLAFIVYIKNYVDPNYTGLDNLKFDSSLSTTMYYVDKDGNEVQLEEDTLVSSENRLWVSYSDIPEKLIDAYVAVEDMRFWEHDGVDTTRTASAIYNFFIPTSSSYGGGSTITQQLIKNVSGENDATIQRKVQEIFRAFNVESKFTKQEILEMYLNTIYLSHNSYGVRVAAQTYFGKELNELTLAECAAIASIGKWPTHYDPISNPQNNLTRRNLVLKLMLEQGMITEEEFNEAYDTPLVLYDGTEEEYSESIHSYYIDAVMDDVISDLMSEYGYDKLTASQMLYSGGLQIITCLDPVIQELAEKVYTDSTYWPETKGMQAQSSICIMDPETGNILALVGGLGEKRESRGLNRVTQTKRPCGSSIKPLSIYAPALEAGLINGGSAVDDVPVVFTEALTEESKDTYWPPNSDRKYRGFVSLEYAIQTSLNTVAVQLCLDMGVENVYTNFKSYGYSTLVDSLITSSGNVLSDINTSPMALGGLTYGVYLREHTQAYATLANNGITSEARTYSEVRDSTGKIILDNKEKHEVKYSESTAVVMTDLLQGVVSGKNGTARARITFWKDYDLEVAGKTGTTDDKRDVWFCGYTPDLVACCWYGYDNNKVITTSGNCAADLWDAVFDEIYAYYEANGIEYKKEFDVPSSMVEVEICTVSGKLPTEACRNDLCEAEGGLDCISTALFNRYDVPTETCDSHILVKWDSVTGGLCLDGCSCPEANIKYVGLRKIELGDRLLHVTDTLKVTVTDAEYIYIELPDGTAYPTSTTLPFFANLLPEGFNVGVSSSKRPANSVCLEHYTPSFDEPVVPSVPAS